jgi:hypothetical protein
MTKRYELIVANVGMIDSYDSLDEAIRQANDYHSGQCGGRGWKEPAYVHDTVTKEIVFEIEPHDVPAEV